MIDQTNIQHGDVLQFQRDDGQWAAYSDAALDKMVYIKDIQKLKQQINNGLNVNSDICNQIAKLGKADFNFIMKHIDKFSNLGLIINYNTFTKEQLTTLLKTYRQQWYNDLQGQDLKQWVHNMLFIYNQKHGTNF